MGDKLGDAFARQVSMASPVPSNREDGPKVEFARLSSNNMMGGTQYYSARKSEGKSVMVTLLEQ